jgi:hypothetical protein
MGTEQIYDQDFYAWVMKNAELLRQGRFPETCPFTIEQVLDLEYWPD